MGVYKLITIEYNGPWGLRSQVPKFVQEILKGIYINFNRQLWCSLDDWYDLSEEGMYLTCF
jgi:hypothetical protein